MMNLGVHVPWKGLNQSGIALLQLWQQRLTSWNRTSGYSLLPLLIEGEAQRAECEPLGGRSETNTELHQPSIHDLLKLLQG